MKPQRLLSIAVAFACSLVIGASALAAIEVDQSNENEDSTATIGAGGTCRAAGQTFTAERSNVAGVVFKLKRSGDFTGADGIEFQLTTATSTPDTAAPYGFALTAAESNALIPDDGNFHEVEFLLDDPIAVSPGTKAWAWIRAGGSNTIQQRFQFSGSYQGLAGQILLPSGGCSSAWNEGTSDSWFQSLYDTNFDGPDLTISATATENSISFAGTFDPHADTMVSLRVDIVGPNLSTWSYAFNPPSPLGTYTSESIQAATDAYYPPGFYILTAYACDTGGCSSVSTSLLVDTESVFDLPTGYVTPMGTPLSGFTGITDSASALLQANGNLIITPDSCNDVVESATSIKQLLICQVQRFQGIPPLSWVYGIFKSFSYAYSLTEPAATSDSYATSDSTILSGSDTPRVQLAIQGNVWGSDIDIDFLDSASSQPAIVTRVKEIFPSYYTVLQLLLWFWFVMSVGRKAQQIVSNNTTIHQQEDQYRAAGQSNV